MWNHFANNINMCICYWILPSSEVIFFKWEEFLARKPIPGKNHPDDDKFLTEAKLSFGDYKLKESPNYKVSLEERETTVKHYKKLLETRGKVLIFSL